METLVPPWDILDESSLEEVVKEVGVEIVESVAEERVEECLDPEGRWYGCARREI